MDIPKGVNQAVIATWATLAMSAVVTTVDKRMGEISEGMFIGSLVFYGLCCIFPYKLSKGSNLTRYLFAILTVIGYLTMLGGVTDGLTRLDLVFSVLTIPVDAFIIWRLFTGEANDWFTTKRPPPLPKAR